MVRSRMFLPDIEAVQDMVFGKNLVGIIGQVVRVLSERGVDAAFREKPDLGAVDEHGKCPAGRVNEAFIMR